MLSEFENSCFQSDLTLQFKSIKDLLDENSILSGLQKPKLPDSFKAMILVSLMTKRRMISNLTAQQQARQTLLRWHAKCGHYFQTAKKKMLTNNPIGKEVFFYRLKFYARKNSRKRIERKKNSIFLELRDSAQSKSFKNISFFEKNQSISEMRRFSGLRTNEMSKDKGSISCISRVQDDFGLELVTYTNIFEKTKDSKATIIKIVYFFNKQIVLHLQSAFNRIQEASYELNYEFELLRARRSLELAEMNFIVQSEIEQIDQHYHEQAEQIDKFSRDFDQLKSKFLETKTSEMVRAMKKIFYPLLSYAWVQLASTFEENVIANKYEVMEIEASESLSIIGSQGRVSLSEKNNFGNFGELDGILN